MLGKYVTIGNGDTDLRITVLELVAFYKKQHKTIIVL